MKYNALFGSILLAYSNLTWAFDCYFTLAKDSCWTNYNVTVDVTDANSAKVLGSVALPKGTQWNRVKFECQPAQKLMYSAQFTPVFWKSDAGKVFYAERYWILPETTKPEDRAWEISSCFPANFAEVPLPPDAQGNCRCDFSSIPAIKPQ